jgi:ornithine carbamoyltransferase
MSVNGTPRHFLDLAAFDASVLRSILDESRARKARNSQHRDKPLADKTLAMIFERPSTRTRISFEVAMRQLGGDVIVLRPDEMQLKRGETVGDTARVLSRYVDAIMIRVGSDEKLRELARFASVPVINGLTDYSHPCQVMADVMTFEEHRGAISGKVVAWSGDANNVCNSWVHAAGLLGFSLRIACPTELMPPTDVRLWARDHGDRVSITQNPREAVAGADLVVTDTWVSMGHEVQNRHNLLAPYRVDAALMAQAGPEALFMHCLPAHRG